MRLGLILLAASLPLTGTIIQNTTVTNNVIYGSGNINAGFTLDQENGIELGLRAKTRFPSSLNDFPNNGAGTFFFPAGNFGPSGNQPSWNFDFSINSNYNGTGANLNAYTYKLELDTNTSAAVTFGPAFDPINQTCTDDAIGNNGTAANSGAFVSNAQCGTLAGQNTYAVLIGSNNLGQNSWRYTFFPAQAPGFDPAMPGIYTIRLSAYSGNTLLAQTSIDVVATPEPAAIVLIGAGLVGIAIRRRVKPQTA